MSKTRASCFIRGSKHLETIKALGLRPRAFICFSVFGTPDETLALVFDILHKGNLETPTKKSYMELLCDSQCQEREHLNYASRRDQTRRKKTRSQRCWKIIAQ